MVKQLFYNDSTTIDGVGERLDKTITMYTTSTYAIIPARLDGLTHRYDDLQDQINRLQDNLKVRQDTMVRQFTAMEELLYRLQAQGADLSQRLGGLLPGQQ